MLLKSIKFKDFRCFKGEHYIDLSTDGDKNVVVILGNNTFGKSTIVLSFIWCFYGISNFSPNEHEIYNRDIANEMHPQAETIPEVEVVFEHENRTYTIRRSQKFFKNIYGRMVPTEANLEMTFVDCETGETKPCGLSNSELNNAMNAILPRDLASYFFFEGEKNNELNTKSLGSAVKNLLGLEDIIKMREHIYGAGSNVSANSVIGQYEKQLNDSADVQAGQEWKNRCDAATKIEKIDKRIKEIDSEINTYEKKINDIQQILRRAEPTKQLQKDRDENKESKRMEELQLEAAYKRYIDDFNDKAVDFFSYALLKRAKNVLDRMELSDKGIKGIDGAAISELLKRGVCLCGTQLNEGSVAYKNVEKYLDILPPKHIGILVSEMIDSISKSDDNAKKYVQTVKENYQSVQYSITVLDRLERKALDIHNKLIELGDINVAQYEIDLQQYQKRRKNYEAELAQKHTERGCEKTKYESADNRYNELIQKSTRNRKIELYLEYAKKIYGWLAETYDKKEEDIRKQLEQEVAQLFNNIYTGNRSVKIDEKYNIVVTPPADTGSLKVIQYFAYVGGLVKVAKNVIVNSGENTQQYGEQFPLVLDAAFSHADENHIKNIGTELSKVTDQLIFAVMGKDWKWIKDSIDKRIAKTYQLRKISENEIAIEEE